MRLLLHCRLWMLALLVFYQVLPIPTLLDPGHELSLIERTFFYFYLFFGAKGRKGEREGEKNIDQLPLARPQLGPGLQSRPVP